VSVVLDTGFVLAVYNRRDEDHAAAAEFLDAIDEDVVTTPLVLAELDHLIGTCAGGAARQTFWADLDAGVWGVRWWASGLAELLEIARRYPYAGLVDASLVALAGILRTNRVLTFDQHFRQMTTPRGEPFVLLPADA
jgi:predicted nucleic acid-binding protein